MRDRQLTLILLLLLAGCSPPHSVILDIPQPGDRAPSEKMDPNRIADAVPRAEPRSSRGNPTSYVVRGKRYLVMQGSHNFVERGIASWYGSKFHGRDTSSGEPYDMYTMTAAHKHLPLPTYAEVTNLRNGRRAIVRINDRGPFHENRIIDLSYAAATKLGIIAAGTGLVEIRALDPADTTPSPRRHIAPSTTPAVVEPGLFIQVGAFSSRKNANRLRIRLERSLKQSIRIQSAGDERRPLFRVQVGPLGDVQQADNLSLQLSQLGIRKTHIFIE